MIKRVVLLVFIGLLYNPFLSFSQDSITSAVDISEKKNIEFQEFFFKALSEKAINNFQKAIDNLENCNQIIPNNRAVLFELSKNYLKLNRFFEATEYANKALAIQPQNIWILEHLVSIHKKNRNYLGAIKVQKDIVKNHPKKKQQLVFLYLQNRDYVSAKKTLQELENSKQLTSRLRQIQASLTRKKTTSKEEKDNKITSNIDLSKQFESDKSYSTLKKLLNKYSKDNNDSLLEYSEKGLELFPAQPFVYLMKGKALNRQKSFKKAIDALQNGIDFVIDNNQMEVLFYLELAKAHKGLGKVKKAEKYRKKAQK